MIHADRNPFRTSRIESLPFRCNRETLASLQVALLNGEDRFYSIWGQKGSGKTHLMLHLVASMDQEGYHVECLTLRDTGFFGFVRQLLHIDGAKFVFVDSAERVPFLLLQLAGNLLAPRSRFILLTHQRPKRAAALYHCQSSVALFQDLLARLEVSVPNPVALRAYKKAGGNIREAFLLLYDLYSHGFSEIEPRAEGSEYLSEEHPAQQAVGA